MLVTATDEAALATAEAAGFVGIIGPSTTTTCRGVAWTDAGEWAQV